MLPKHIIDQLPVPQAVPETLQTHHLSSEFLWEVQYRQGHAQYCQWYDEVAAQHQRDFAQMQTELNILGWLRGQRS